MSKAEERACQYTGYCKNQSYSDFLNGYRQAEKDVIERAAEWIKLYVLNHDTIDIFEMEDEFKKSMMEE